MAAIQDASGKLIPSWARYVKTVAAAGSFTGYADSTGNLIPFAFYLYDDSTVVFAAVDEPDTDITFTFGPGYHVVAATTITSTTAAMLLLFANKPLSA